MHGNTSLRGSLAGFLFCCSSGTLLFMINTSLGYFPNYSLTLDLYVLINFLHVYSNELMRKPVGGVHSSARVGYS